MEKKHLIVKKLTKENLKDVIALQQKIFCTGPKLIT